MRDGVTDITRIVESHLRLGKPWEAMIALGEWCREFRSIEEIGPNEHVSRLTAAGVSTHVCERLEEAGYLTLGTLDDAPDDDLLAVTGVGMKHVNHIRRALKRLDIVTAARHSVAVDR